MCTVSKRAKWEKHQRCEKNGVSVSYIRGVWRPTIVTVLIRLGNAHVLDLKNAPIDYDCRCHGTRCSIDVYYQVQTMTRKQEMKTTVVKSPFISLPSVPSVRKRATSGKYGTI